MEFALRYLAYVFREIKLGIQDNFQGIKQIVLHPIHTLLSLFDALMHPITTLQNIYRFAKGSPIRFGTNLTLSYLEGRSIVWAWGKCAPLVVENIPAIPLQRHILNYFPLVKSPSHLPVHSPCCIAKHSLIHPYSLHSAPIINNAHAAALAAKHQTCEITPPPTTYFRMTRARVSRGG